MVSLLDRVKELDLGYPLGANELGPAAKASELSELGRRLQGFEMAELLGFYTLANGLTLADVHVGYFLHPISKIVAGDGKGEPTSISGSLAGEIIVFGSDGGGSRFALAKEGHILYLPTGAVRQGVFEGEGRVVRQIADGFTSFLDRLLADIRAFVEHYPEWKYIS